MSRPLVSRSLVAFVFFVERWLLSALFLFLAWEHISILRLMVRISQLKAVLPASLLAHDGNFSNGVTFDDYARYLLLAISFGVSGFLLLISRKPRHGPTTAREIVIPFAATFSSLAFDRHIVLPAWMVTPMIPEDWKPVAAGVGIAVSAAGLALSTYTLLWLGRSMGIVVTVREVVLGGPYRWVRHPMYLGYLSVLTGTFMVSWTLRSALAVVGAVALLVWRARLEEKLLGTHSPAYREWMRRTGFLWPRRQTEKAEGRRQKAEVQPAEAGGRRETSSKALLSGF